MRQIRHCVSRANLRTITPTPGGFEAMSSLLLGPFLAISSVQVASSARLSILSKLICCHMNHKVATRQNTVLKISHTNINKISANIKSRCKQEVCEHYQLSNNIMHYTQTPSSATVSAFFLQSHLLNHQITDSP